MRKFSDVVVSGLSVSFENKRVLQNFSHTFKASSVTCLMGASGIGKTTLFRVLLGLIKPQQGSITGLPLRIAAVFQEDRLIEYVSAVENILPALRNTTFDDFVELFCAIKPLLYIKNPLFSKKMGLNMGPSATRNGFAANETPTTTDFPHITAEKTEDMPNFLGDKTTFSEFQPNIEASSSTCDALSSMETTDMGDTLTNTLNFDPKPHQFPTKTKKLSNKHKILLIQHHLAVLGLSKEDSLVPVSTLSGGMRRRVALVRAMLANTPLILLDEAFKGLDERNRRTAIRYTQLIRRGATLIYSTHEQEVAQEMQGETLTLDNGQKPLAVISAKVIKGKGLGRTLGFPTANLCVDGNPPPLRQGVYAVITELPSGKRLPAVLNQGKHPTLPEGDRTVEVHIPSFEGNLYGQRLTIEYRRFLRPEITFPSKEALSLQLQKDVDTALLFLEESL